MDEHLSEAETREDTRISRVRRPNSTIDQQEALQEKLNTLEHSRRGYLGSLTRIYNQIDVLLTSYDNVAEIKELHSKLRLAWRQYESCCVQFLTLVDKKDELYARVSAQYEEQNSKTRTYDATVDQYVADTLVHFNAQVMEDVSRWKTNSIASNASRVSTATSKLREAKLAASRASLIEKQTESRKKRAIQLELAKMDMEIKRRELEYKQRLELAQIEMENEVVAARDNTELAELEARMAEQAVSELMKYEDKESNRTCPSPIISSSARQEPKSSRPNISENVPPTKQSSFPMNMPPLQENSNVNPASSILHEGIKHPPITHR